MPLFLPNCFIFIFASTTIIVGFLANPQSSLARLGEFLGHRVKLQKKYLKWPNLKHLLCCLTSLVLCNPSLFVLLHITFAYLWVKKGCGPFQCLERKFGIFYFLSKSRWNYFKTSIKALSKQNWRLCEIFLAWQSLIEMCSCNTKQLIIQTHSVGDIAHSILIWKL